MTSFGQTPLRMSSFSVTEYRLLWWAVAIRVALSQVVSWAQAHLQLPASHWACHTVDLFLLPLSALMARKGRHQSILPVHQTPVRRQEFAGHLGTMSSHCIKMLGPRSFMERTMSSFSRYALMLYHLIVKPSTYRKMTWSQCLVTWVCTLNPMV